MFLNAPLLPIIVAAVFVVALNSVWHSSVIFGKIYARAYGISREELFSNEKGVMVATLASILLYMFFFCILAVLLKLHEYSSMQELAILACIGGLLSVTVIHTALWERRAVSYICIHTVYVLVVTGVGYSIITYWPW